MGRRRLILEKYRISKKRYKELSGFCEQYPEWKRKLFQGVSGDMAERYRGFCALVEKVAAEAGGDLAKYLIWAVCYEESVHNLISSKGMPQCKTSFYEMRRRFFFLLDKEKYGI